jgi:phosphoribosylanthranilate isomerase
MTSPVRVKICGITRVEDALHCARAGADAIGLVFYAPSPRNVGIEQARSIVSALPPFVTSVGLFVDADPAWVEAVCSALPLDLLQFHGAESASNCERYGRPYIKAVRVRQRSDIEHACQTYASSRGILVDAFVDGIAGGTGQAFDWTLATGSFGKDIILAGGLNPANVASAIRQVQPWAVDVSGGVEAAKGIKDADRITHFMQEVHRAKSS